MVHQPEHLPWLGFFDRMAQVDHLVLLDTVRFSRRDFQSRNLVLGPDGIRWVRVSLSKPVDVPIHDVLLAEDVPWRQKVEGTLAACYGKAPYFNMLKPILSVYGSPRRRLVDLNESLIVVLKTFLGIKTPMSRASELGVDSPDREHRILGLCLEVGADTLLCGPYSWGYRNHALFRRCGVKVELHNFNHPVYSQDRRQGFVPKLSAVDFIANIGPKAFGSIAPLLSKD